MKSRLTVNYGVRWDADWGATAPPHVTTQTKFNPRGGVPYNDVAIAAGDNLFKTDIRDIKNIAPRGGFSWNVKGDGSFVIRGGSGLYYSIPDSNTTFSQQSFNGERIRVNSFVNDRLPGFIQDPTRGKTAQDFISGKYPLPPQAPRVIAHDYKMPYTWQSTIGFQKQLGPVMMFEADFTKSKAYNQARSRDLNLFYNPANGYNLNPNAATGRPDPNYTTISWLESTGRADSAQISAALHRRFRNNLQASMTYSYTISQNDNTTGFQYQPNNVFDTTDADYARSTEFQRHTLRLNALYNLPWGFSVSGAYLYGSGNYYANLISTSPFGAGASQNRLLLPTAAAITVPQTIAISPTIPTTVPVASRFSGPAVIAPGTSVPRNALVGLPLHKVDLRITKDVKLQGDLKLTGILEGFNVLNHANFGAYNAYAQHHDVRPAAPEHREYLPAASAAVGAEALVLGRHSKRSETMIDPWRSKTLGRGSAPSLRAALSLLFVVRLRGGGPARRGGVAVRPCRGRASLAAQADEVGSRRLRKGGQSPGLGFPGPGLRPDRPDLSLQGR